MPHSFLPSPITVAILGCPFSGGQPKEGVALGPSAMVDSGLVDQLTELGCTVNFDDHLAFAEVPDDPPHGIIKNPRRVSQANQLVAQHVAAHAKNGELPVTLGGDHSLGLGTISGTLAAYPEACVIWVDAHADINTPETTETGNMHGMPLSLLLGLGSHLPMFDWVNPALKAGRLVYIGLRDVDAGEKVIIKENNIKAFSMHEVQHYGIAKVVEMALDHVNPDRNLPIHMSVDVDSLDPSEAPSTGTVVRGGLSYRQGHYICEMIWKTGLLVALDLVEVNPTLGSTEDAEKTIAAGCSLVRSALGATLL